MSFRTILILFNVALILGFAGFVIYRVVSLRRNPEPKQPDNLTPFFDDDVLEGAHLERALGVALIALVVVVLALLAYFIWEPFREADANDGFKDRSIERGAVLFANSASKEYDSTKSLLCANCHGIDGGGGTAPFVVKSEDPRCDPNQVVDAKLAEEQPYCLPAQVAWAAPNLRCASLKYDRQQLTQIITYGRPGTPMPAWGVLSGKGALQEQSIQDLVNYVESLGTTPDKAQAAATEVEAAADESRQPRRVRRARAAREARDPRRRGQVGRRRPGRARRCAGVARRSHRRRGRRRRTPSSCSRSRRPCRSPSDWQQTTQSAERRRSSCS